MKYKIIALIGEAGSGKDTILQDLLQNSNFNEIISYTTRPPRDGEINGKNYFFLSPEEFLDKIQEDVMLEYTVFNGWFYGTPKEILKEGVNIGVFNPGGVWRLSQNDDIDLQVFKIECDAAERLRRQLNREQNPNVDEIVRRYTADKQDFRKLDFDVISIPNATPQDRELAVKLIMDKIV